MALSNKKRALTAILTNCARLLLSAVLIVSGFVKAADPAGLCYKLQEYLTVFDIVEISESWVQTGAILLSAVEFITGVMLLMGVYTGVITLLVFIFFLFFTPFTLLLAYWNPVRDCGCFGDAFHLSNWATFGKNVVLLACATLVWLRHRLFVRRISMTNRWMVSLFAICYIALVEGLSISHLPIIDFRPFAVGNNLREAVADIPDIQKVVYRFEKDGNVVEYSNDTYPDSTWNYLGSSSITVKKGRPALIGDFAFIDMVTGEDYADIILEDTGYVCLLFINQIKTADESRVDKINDLYEYCKQHDASFYAATSSDEEDVAMWQKRTGAEYDFLWADGIMLKTAIRSNPGVLLLKDGKIVGKWNATDLPPVELYSKSSTKMPDRISSIYSYIRGWKRWIILFAVPLLFIMLIDMVTSRCKKKETLKNILATDDMTKKEVTVNE